MVTERPSAAPMKGQGARTASPDQAKGSEGARSPESRIRDVLDAVAVGLDVFERAGRLHNAMAGASWNTLKTLFRIAGTIMAPSGVPPGPATCLRYAAAREIARRPRYQMGERLGIGGMGEVFRGWQIGEVGFERPVAIKRMLPGLLAGPTVMRCRATAAAARRSVPSTSTTNSRGGRCWHADAVAIGGSESRARSGVPSNATGGRQVRGRRARPCRGGRPPCRAFAGGRRAARQDREPSATRGQPPATRGAR